MNDEHLISISRHLIWADSFRTLAGEAITRAASLEMDEFYSTAGGGYLLAWYGLLFAICEELREQKVKVCEIQNDIDSIFSSLRRCRNAVFHIQSKYWSKKLLDFITVAENATKVHRIHNGLGKWAAEEMERRGLA